jgi:excisionase family DNA binding protein
MKDRSMQALYLLALLPVAETTSDPNSYGFRPARSTADAIEQCFCALARKDSAPWVLEGDIQHLIFDKELPVVRVGHRVHLHRPDLDDWIEQNKE